MVECLVFVKIDIGLIISFWLNVIIICFLIYFIDIIDIKCVICCFLKWLVRIFFYF